MIPLLSITAHAQDVPETVNIEGIPQSLEWVIKPDAFGQDDNGIVISAGSNTNMFFAPHGNFRASNMPKLLFHPAHDFILSAKATAQHESKWDAAMLVVYIDENYWAKFCFENEYPGKQRMVSVVTNEISDDAYSDVVTENTIYMRIAKKGPQIEFAYSRNGNEWIGVRYFRLNSDDPLRVGFASQSPIGKGLTSTFSEIHYESLNNQ